MHHPARCVYVPCVPLCSKRYCLSLPAFPTSTQCEPAVFQVDGYEAEKKYRDHFISALCTTQPNFSKNFLESQPTLLPCGQFTFPLLHPIRTVLSEAAGDRSEWCPQRKVLDASTQVTALLFAALASMKPFTPGSFLTLWLCSLLSIPHLCRTLQYSLSLDSLL